MGHKARISAVVVAIWLIIVVAGCNSEKEATVPVIDTMAQNTESTTTANTTPQSTKNTTSVIEEDIPAKEQTTSQKQSISTDEDETTPATDATITGITDVVPYIFLNEFGDVVDIREADRLHFMYGSDTVEFTPDEAIENGEFVADFSGYTYMTKSKGVSYNSIMDSYNEGTYSFDIKPPDQNYEYFKVSVGDKFGDLTVKEAFVNFYKSKTGGFYQHVSTVSFSGDLTVSGYIAKTVEMEGYVAGDYYFVPDAKSWGEVPIYLYSGLFDTFTVFDLAIASDIEFLFLVLDNENNASNIDDVIPNEKTFVHVLVTISDIIFKDFTNTGTGGRFGKIASISLI